MQSVDPLHAWINHVFDHPVSDPPWYCDSDTEEWPEPAESVLEHIAETFENAGPLLSTFSDEQLDQGFWYLFYQGASDFMGTLLDERAPLAIRLRALRSFVPMFAQVMAARCSSHLSHLDEKGAKALNSACYMWFDEVLDRFQPQKLIQARLDTELPTILSAILALPHDACRESALHGIRHWVGHFPVLTEIADQFLSSNRGLRRELVVYAESARAGSVL